jgi:hypothetical protein
VDFDKVAGAFVDPVGTTRKNISSFPSGQFALSIRATEALQLFPLIEMFVSETFSQ